MSESLECNLEEMRHPRVIDCLHLPNPSKWRPVIVET